MSAISNFINWSVENIWVYFAIILIYIYYKYSNKEKISNFSMKEMYFILEYGIYILIIYLCQKHFFNEHTYFLISIPLFILIWGFAINYILSQDDVYMLETALMGEKFNDLVNGTPVISLTTRLRLLIMDRSYYNEKMHIGDINNPMLNTSRKIKFTDLYDDNTGIFYHSEYAELQNINFYTRIATWLKLKEDIPKIIKENITHTWLNDYKIASQLDTMKDNFVLSLTGIKDQHKDKPFNLFPDMKELMEYVNKMKVYSNEDNTKSENKNTENKENESIEGEP